MTFGGDPLSQLFLHLLGLQHLPSQNNEDYEDIHTDRSEKPCARVVRP